MARHQDVTSSTPLHHWLDSGHRCTTGWTPLHHWLDTAAPLAGHRCTTGRTVDTAAPLAGQWTPLHHWLDTAAPLAGHRCTAGRTPLHHWPDTAAPLAGHRCTTGRTPLHHWPDTTRHHSAHTTGDRRHSAGPVCHLSVARELKGRSYLNKHMTSLIWSVSLPCNITNVVVDVEVQRQCYVIHGYLSFVNSNYHQKGVF